MKILVYPVGDNPYQKLLYDEIKKNPDIQIKYVRNEFIDTKHGFILGFPLFPIRFLFYRLTGWKILHLHWLSPFVFPTKLGLFRLLSSIYAISFMFYLKLIGIKIVWTIHEVLPHEQEFHNDILVRRIISELSNNLIFHSNYSLNEAKRMQFNTNHSIVIGHGNYTKIYPNTISRSKARNTLGLKSSDFVYLFFGMIKKYKGIEDLLISFEKIINTHKYKNIKLLIAGKCLDDELKQFIKKYSNKFPKHVATALHHIQDNDVQLYFNSSDVVVLPFIRNTTGGSAFLALSFGKPIIAPRIGNLIDLPDNTGLYYNLSNKKNYLFQSMIKILNQSLNLKLIGTNGYKFVKKSSWKEIANSTYNLYKS